MSYTKVKSIGIDKKNKKVSITGADSSLRPIKYSRWEAKYLSNILQTKGEKYVISYLVHDFLAGNAHEIGTNRYAKTAFYCKQDPEFIEKGLVDYKTREAAMRDAPEFVADIIMRVHNNAPSGKKEYYIKLHNGRWVYKINRTSYLHSPTPINLFSKYQADRFVLDYFLTSDQSKKTQIIHKDKLN